MATLRLALLFIGLCLAASSVSASGRAVVGKSLSLPQAAPTTPSHTPLLVHALSRDIEDDTASALATVYNGGLSSGRCKITCEGHDVGSSNDAKYKSCWGDFRIFCKWSKNSTEDKASACGVVGLKCEGHWIYVPGEDNKVVACDGLLKRFSKTAITTSEGGGAHIFKAGGCLGTAVGIMAARTNDSSTATMPVNALAGAGEDSFLEDADLAPVVEHLHDSSSAAKTLFEGRCEGPGGKVTGVRRMPRGAAATTAERLGTFESLEAEADKAVMEFDFPKAPKPEHKEHKGWHHHHDSHLPHFLKHFAWKHLHSHQHEHKDITCVKLCNGKVPWFHGALPCFGVASLHCYGSFDPSSLLRARHCGKGHGKGSKEHHPEELHPSQQAAAPLDKSFSFDFKATCKGAFTGIFGKKCMGFSSEVLAMDEKVEKYEYCSGTKGARFKKARGQFAMGKWCKGKSLVAVQKTEEGQGVAPLQLQ